MGSTVQEVFMSQSTRILRLGLTLAFALLAISAAAAQQNGPLPQPAPAPAAQNAPATQPAPAPDTKPAAAPAPGAPAAKIEVPSGTHLPLVLHNGISTRSARVGDPVYFETLFPILIGGHVVIPAGSYVSGVITETKRAGRVKGRAELQLRLQTLILPNAYMVSFAGTPGNAGTGGSESVDNEGKIKGDSDKGSDAATIAKSTSLGAGIGAVATRTAGGAGIGAGIGATAGLIAVLLSRGPEAELPRGTTLEAVLDRPLFLDADKAQFSSPGQASTLAGPPEHGTQRTRFPY